MKIQQSKKDRRKVRNTKSKDKLLYDSIQFRSGLEVYCYKQLKINGLETNYETLTIELVPKFTFTGEWLESSKKGLKLDSANCRPMTYTPDFVANDLKWIIECKGFASDTWLMKRKLIKQYFKNENIKYYVPSTQKQVDEVVRRICAKSL